MFELRATQELYQADVEVSTLNTNKDVQCGNYLTGIQAWRPLPVCQTYFFADSYLSNKYCSPQQSSRCSQEFIYLDWYRLNRPCCFSKCAFFCVHSLTHLHLCLSFLSSDHYLRRLQLRHGAVGHQSRDPEPRRVGLRCHPAPGVLLRITMEFLVQLDQAKPQTPLGMSCWSWGQVAFFGILK